jgi:predicted  nucleic acid-binding Zn-ribbon protein
MGSLFGLDHATARHGYRNFETFRSQDEQLENLFQKVFEIYSSEKAVIDELDLNNLQIEVTEKDVKIEQLNFEVFRLNKEIEKLKNEKREYADILNILRMKVPNNKKEIAARKINTVLNSI